MFGIGTTELIVILVIVMIIFGGSRLPQLGEGLGKAIRGFKKGISDSHEESAKKDNKENKG